MRTRFTAVRLDLHLVCVSVSVPVPVPVSVAAHTSGVAAATGTRRRRDSARNTQQASWSQTTVPWTYINGASESLCSTEPPTARFLVSYPSYIHLRCASLPSLSLSPLCSPSSRHRRSRRNAAPRIYRAPARASRDALAASTHLDFVSSLGFLFFHMALLTNIAEPTQRSAFQRVVCSIAVCFSEPNTCCTFPSHTVLILS
jgi:hypothetical protein